MSLHLQQFTDYVITPVLQKFDLWSPAATILLLGTAMVESRLKYIHQIGGPALGVYQMEPATHDDIWENYLKYRCGLATTVFQMAHDPYDMQGNLYYATLMCRLHYRRVSEPLPLITAEAMARYHKKYYNTVLGKTNPEESSRVFAEIIAGGYA